MAIELKMPALSPAMEKGTLAKWLVREGDAVKPGDLIAEIETDKATLDFEVTDEGVIASITVPAGTEDVTVGTVIAIIAAPGEANALPLVEMADAAPLAAPATPMTACEFTASAPNAVTKAEEGDITATPLVRRIATAKGLSLLGIYGSGVRGRIVKADLGLPSPTAAPVVERGVAGIPAVATVHAPPAGVPMEKVKLGSMRKTIARRMSEAKQTVPHFYLTAHCRIDALLALRHDLNANLFARDVKLSVNDLVIKAMAIAMTREPDVNVQFADEDMYRFSQVDIAMAVAIDGGLITPIIRDVATLSLSAVAQQSRQLAARARAGKLSPEEYQGGTASISNLGMYGIDEMIPVINLPQALILGIGTGIEKPWKVDGQLGLATIMTATASFDHRAIDGAAAARFMAAFRNALEEPLQIIC